MDPNFDDFVDLGPELFASGDLTVISYKGQNYYKACGVTVTEQVDVGTSTCVKRVDHPGFMHEDYEGTVLGPAGDIRTLDDQIIREVRTVLKRSGLDVTEVFNALNALKTLGIRLSMEA